EHGHASRMCPQSIHLGATVRLVFVFLFLLALRLLSLRARAIPASCLELTLSAHFLLRMLAAAHLSVTRSHLWIAGHLIPHMRLAARTSGTSHFAGVHLGLV